MAEWRAAHAIPLNVIGAAVTLTTDRNAALAKLGPLPSTFAVLLDDSARLAALLAQGWPRPCLVVRQPRHASERLVAGPLAEDGEEILRTHTGIKAARAWVMDVWVGKEGNSTAHN